MGHNRSWIDSLKTTVDAILRYRYKAEHKIIFMIGGGAAFVMLCNIYALLSIGLKYFSLGFEIFSLIIFVPIFLMTVGIFWFFQKHVDGAAGFFIATIGCAICSFVITYLLNGVMIALTDLIS